MKLHSINKNNLIILKYIEKNIKSSNNPIYSLKLSFCSNSCDNFVKMYLGRIGVENKNDAFMLTQYLGKGVKINKINPDKEDNDYEFKALDNHSDNCKKYGKRKIIIDAGAIMIIKKSTGDIVSDF